MLRERTGDCNAGDGDWFAFVFPARAGTLRAMSLNRSEQLVSDYIESHPEEKNFWVQKVQGLARSEPETHVAASRLADDLWSYFEERSAVAEPFRRLAQREGLHRTSMRNLAEYWLRLWVAPKPRRPPTPESFSDKF